MRRCHTYRYIDKACIYRVPIIPFEGRAEVSNFRLGRVRERREGTVRGKGREERVREEDGEGEREREEEC